jgi:DNA-binding transcriptional LysR family regulator
MELSLGSLRTIRTVAERRSFTAAAAELGYTQSAVSRQVAAAERELGTKLFDRVRGGVRLTNTGSMVLRQVVIALNALDQAQQDIRPTIPSLRRLRLGAFSAAGSALLPRSIAALCSAHADLEVSTRQGTTPALVRGVRSGSLDGALIAERQPYRSPDQEAPPLVGHALLDIRLMLAASANGRFSGLRSVHYEEAAREAWIATPSGSDEPQLGVWPGLPGRPRVRHWARDWNTKLALVAENVGVTTIPAELFPSLPVGVALLGIDGVPDELRRVTLVHRHDADRQTVDALVNAFGSAAAALAAAVQPT